MLFYFSNKMVLFLITTFKSLPCEVIYSGKYLGIVDRKVVIVDKDLGRVFQKVTKEYPGKIPRISYIPREDELDLLI